MTGRFITGIGALVYNPDDKTYLLLKRSPQKDFGSGTWECVTGRLEQGEGFEEGLHREALEEIGIEVQPEFIIGTSHFYRGAPVPENELVGVIYCCTTFTPTALRISAEHSEYRWLTADSALELITAEKPSDRWLRHVIRRAELINTHLPADLRTVFRAEGFETNRSS
jgi:8-oxo-dGTP diphosphatase